MSTREIPEEEMTMDDRPIPDEWVRAAMDEIDDLIAHEHLGVREAVAERVIAAVRPLIEEDVASRARRARRDPREGGQR